MNRILISVNVFFFGLLCVSNVLPFYHEFQPENTPTKEIQGYFHTCRMFEDSLQAICAGHHLSCTNRCGFYAGRVKNKFNGDPCSCDSLCVTLGDCCWDFFDQCPVEANRQEKRFSHLTVDSVTCERDIAVIGGPRNTSGGLSVHEDFMVTDGKTGLTFRNIVAYRNHFNKSLDDNTHDGGSANDNNTFYGDHLHVWSKTFLALHHVFNFSDVRGVIDEDKWMDESMLVDVSPEMVKMRMCRRRIALFCEVDHGSSSCNEQKPMQMDSLAKVCEKGRFPNAQVFNATDTQSIQSTTSLPSAGQTTPSGMDPNNTDAYQNGECFISLEFLYQQKEHFFVLKVMFGVNKVKGTLEVSDIVTRSFLLPNYWKRVRCGNHNKGNCDLVVLCDRGNIFVGSKCRRPSKLIIEAIGQEDNPDTLTKVMNGVTDAIKQNIPDGLNISNNPTSITTYYNCTGIVLLSYEMELTTYDIELGETSLPVTSTVTKYLTTMFPQDSSVQQVVICFATEDETNIGANPDFPMSCDSLLYADNFVPEHFELKGIQSLHKLRQHLAFYAGDRSHGNVSKSDKIQILLILIVSIISLKTFD